MADAKLVSVGSTGPTAILWLGVALAAAADVVEVEVAAAATTEATVVADAGWL